MNILQQLDARKADQSECEAALASLREQAVVLRTQVISAGHQPFECPKLTGDLFEDIEALDQHTASLRGLLQRPAPSTSSSARPAPSITAKAPGGSHAAAKASEPAVSSNAPGVEYVTDPKMAMSLTQQCLARREGKPIRVMKPPMTLVERYHASRAAQK